MAVVIDLVAVESAEDYFDLAKFQVLGPFFRVILFYSEPAGPL